MTDKRLKSFADRIDRLEDERKELGGDIKDVYTEVKSAGYNTKALRKVLAERRKKSDAELEADMELYRAALAEPGATYRSVAEKTGVPRSTLHRLVPRKINGTETTHDADGVITEYNAGPDEGASGSSQTPNNAPQADRQESPAMPLPNGGVGDGTHSGGDAQDESCGGRGVDKDNPAPHGLEPEEKGPGTPDNASSLLVEAGQRCGTVGNVAILETAPDRMLPPSPLHDTHSRVVSNAAGCGEEIDVKGKQDSVSDPPAGGVGITSLDTRGEAPNPDGLDIPKFLRRQEVRA